MKFLRMIGLFISKVALVVAVVGLILSFSLNSFIKEGVSSVLVNNSVAEEVFEEIGIESEQIQKIIEIDDAQQLIDKYINPLLDSEVDASNINIGYDLLEFVKNNEEKIESIIEKEIPMNEIEGYVKSEEMAKISETYKSGIEQIRKEIPSEVNEASSVLKCFFSAEARNIMFIVGIVGLLVTILLQWSLYLWMKTLGNIFTWSSLLVVIFSGLGSIFVTGLFQNIKIDFTKVLVNSLVIFGCGVILLILYMIIEKFISKTKKKEIV